MAGAQADCLRARARDALHRGGLPFDEEVQSAYLVNRFEVARPYATNLSLRLETIAQPTSEVERSFISSVPTMAAFAFTITDCAYRVASVQSLHQDDVRGALTAYIVGSSIFDYACDEDRKLLPLIRNQLTEARLRGILEPELVKLDTVADGPPLVRYFWLLLADFAASISLLGASRSPAMIRSLRRQVVQSLIETYQAEVASTTASSADRAIIWSSPLLMSYLLMQLSSDASAQISPQLEVSVRQVGMLLELVDDVTDIDDDWTSNSRNKLLTRLRADHKNGDRTIHWGAMLSDELSKPHMGQITTLAAACAGSPWAQDVAAWLYYWLYS